MTLMGDYEGYFITAGVFMFVFACLWAIMKYGRYRQETGGGYEKLSEARAGLSGAEKKVQEEQAAAEAEEKKEERIAAEEEAKEAADKKAGAGESTIDAEKAEVEEVEVAEEQAKVEEESEAVTGRTVGLVAAIKETSDATARYIAEREKLETGEEQEMPVLKSLMKKIWDLEGAGNIDAASAKYLASYVEKNLGGYLDDMLKREEGKAGEMKTFLGFLKEAVNAMMESCRGARADLRRLGTEEREERKKFGEEIKAAEESIKAKEKELHEASKEEGADPSVVASLRKAIALAQEQAKTANQVNGKLEDTYAFMKKEIGEMKQLLRKVTRIERAAKRYDEKVKKREEDVEKRTEGFKDAVEEIKKHAESFSGEGARPEIIITKLSSDMSKFFAKFEEVIKADIEFDKAAREIIVQNIIVAEQIKAFEKLEESLSESEEAVEKGAEALKRIIDAITGAGGAEAAIDAEVMKALEESSGRIAYMEKIQKWMENITERVKEQSAAEEERMGGLVKMDEKTLAEAQASRERNSQHIGQAMATIVARKEALDAKYRPQAAAFGAQLEKRNEIAAAAYRQAQQVERKAA